MKKMNLKLINKSAIARELGVTSQYISAVILGRKKSPKMLAKIENLIKKQLNVCNE